MTETEIRRALEDSVRAVLETMFFVEASPAHGDAGGSSADDIAVRMAFHGEPPGSLRLRVSAAAAREIAADFLGIEAVEISDRETAEVARELANMICGSVLSRVESAATFRLEAPEILPPGTPPDGMPAAAFLLDRAGGRLEVSLTTSIALPGEPSRDATGPPTG